MSKNIVLLSDGTGNSSAKVFKTNVWRLFQILDLTDPDKQVAYYDNGVGTSSFKLFAVLGGVFGFGLKRNVIDIYSFCCRNYQEGDRIYGFGFSRGAFTMRVVAGLIARQGLVPYDGDEAALARYAKSAYRDYRRRFNSTKGLVDPLRKARDGIVKVWRRIMGYKQYDSEAQITVPSIHFLGLWDTVDAYGGPIEEITRAIDYWYWPLSMPDRFINAKYHRACHALAIEDERDAFRPVLWDERYTRREDKKLHDIKYGWEPDVSPEWEPKLKPIDKQRLSQVWFVGVHSDIGGGYPQDGLSYVTLDWMIERAKPYGLLLDPTQREQLRPLVNPYDKLNDSRHGVAGYYRYKPRNIYEIHNSPPYKPSVRSDLEYMRGELIGRDYTQKDVVSELATGTRFTLPPPPTIHQAVFDRIDAISKPDPAKPFKVATDGYIPIVLPESYHVTDKDGDLKLSNYSGDPEPPRFAQSALVWNRVWWKRVVYFLTLFVSVALAAVPLLDDPTFGANTPLVLIRPLLALAAAFLPGFLAPWFEAYSAAPGLFVLGVAIVGALLWLGGWLQENIRNVMRAIWIKQPPAAGMADRIAASIRTRPGYRMFFYALKHWLLPSFFALLILWSLLALASQLAFRTADAFGTFCEPTSSARSDAGSGSSVMFKTSDFCKATQISVIKDETYRVTIEVKSRWMDSTIPTTPEGFGFKKMTLPMYPWIVFRRVLFAQWFKPVLRIGNMGGEEHVLDMKANPPGQAQTYEALLKPRRNGEVFVFVNDAVLGLPWVYDCFYRNNHPGKDDEGPASITIEPLRPAR